MNEKLNLFTDKMKNIYVKFEYLEKAKEELENLISLLEIDKKEVKDILVYDEIKANNLVEGYNDNLDFIENTLENNKKKKNANTEKEQRILNLYHGYNYILKNNDINRDNLKKLYDILSRNLLIPYDLEHMGEYYREEKVLIYTSSNVAKEPEEGFDFRVIDYYMNKLIEFINEDHKFMQDSDYFIKSQIIHFYFVYIHPYFDVNGRTSRTLSMWYLLNKEKYPFILFNQGINYHKNLYYTSIMEAKKYGNITIFIKYMLKIIKEELEKEYAILEIKKNNIEITALERQAINYLLTMKNNYTVKDFYTFYRRYNEFKSLREVHEHILENLMEKEIIKYKRDTNKGLYDGKNNYVFSLNEDIFENYYKLVKNI